MRLCVWTALAAALAACSGNTINTSSGGFTVGASSSAGVASSGTTSAQQASTTGANPGSSTGAGSTTGAQAATSASTSGTTSAGASSSGTASGGTSTGGSTSAYPGSASTWGPAVGQTFPDWSLAGGAILNFATTPTTDSTGSLASSFSFQQLYDAAGLGFRYAFIDISAVWCPHCNDEANTLPKQYVPGWLAEGGIVFSILVEGATPGVPATEQDLVNWVSQYKINYPMSLDSQENMVGGTGLNAWPANLIIRLRDMTVMDSVFGATDAFYSEFSAQLTVCQSNSDCWSGATCTLNQCH